MEQNKETQENQVPQPHPTLITIRNFLGDCLTEAEYFARCSAVLQLLHPSVIIEAARQVQAQAPQEGTDQPAE